MTLPEPPLSVPDDDALDAAASAVVDGVATPEEADAVAAAPDGAARVAALRAVAASVGSPVSPQDPGAAAGALAAALAAFDAQVGAEAAEDEHEDAGRTDRPGASAVSVTSLPQAAKRRNGLPRLGAVAAALLLIVGIGAFAAGLRSNSDDTTFSAAAPSTAATEAGSARSAAGTAAATDSITAPGGAATTIPRGVGNEPLPATPPSGPSAAAGAPPVVNGGEVGRQDAVEALSQRAAAALDGEAVGELSAAAAALPKDVQACVAAAPAAAGETVGPLRYRAVGSFQGTPAVVLAYDRPTGQRLLLVLARSGCGVLATSRF